jgi:hypothetical protein
MGRVDRSKTSPPYALNERFAFLNRETEKNGQRQGYRSNPPVQKMAFLLFYRYVIVFGHLLNVFYDGFFVDLGWIKFNRGRCQFQFKSYNPF